MFEIDCASLPQVKIFGDQLIDKNGRKTPLSLEVVCSFKCLISGPQNKILKSEIRGKLLLLFLKTQLVKQK